MCSFRRPSHPTPRGRAACKRVQREGEAVHVIATRLEDLADLLESVEGREDAFPLRHGRGDEARCVVGADPRGRATETPGSGLRPAAGIRVPTRDSR